LKKKQHHEYNKRRKAMLLTNRVAIITGGAKGIGRGTALKFSGEGCSIAIADINAKDANNVVAELSGKGGNAIALQCNVTDKKQVHDMVDKVISKFGKVDILFNGAGGLPRIYSTVDLAEDEWDRVLALNLKSCFLCSQAVISHMQEKKYGRIINISSIGALYPPASAAHYNTAKMGVLGFTYALASELAPFNILVNAILPGPIGWTSFWDPLVPPDADRNALFADMGKKTVPLGRIGTPDDIAGAALFLASEHSSFITGVGLNVAGGIPFKPSAHQMK
jgi:3-oxoacyl-[acyl-carrier protein] reductase